MNARTPIINASGDYEENLERLAKHLKKDRMRREILTVVYGRGTKPKSKKQIAEILGISGSLQPLQNALEYMANHHLILRIPNDGTVDDRSRHLYGKEEFMRVNRSKILAFADDTKRLDKLATKRKPQSAISRAIFDIKRKTQNVNRAKTSSKPSEVAVHRIAILTASPIGENALDVSLEAREIENERQKAVSRDKFDVRLFPAATAESLLSAINDYQPDIIHFSGHGNSFGLEFDNTTISDVGGTHVNFKIVANLLKTAPMRPKLVFLNACKSVGGLEIIAKVADVVIAMKDSVNDSTAFHYSRRFYASLFSGLSIENSHLQAKTILEIDDPSGASLPIVASADGIHPSNIRFS